MQDIKPNPPNIKKVLETGLLGLYKGHCQDHRCYLLFQNDSGNLFIKYSYGLSDDDQDKTQWSTRKMISQKCHQCEVFSLEIPEDQNPIQWAKDENIDKDYVKWMISSDMTSVLFHPIELKNGGLAFVYVIESKLTREEAIFLDHKFIRFIGAMGYKIGYRLPEFQPGEKELREFDSLS